MLGEQAAAADLWPENLEEITGDEKAYLAVVHADGNGLGETIIRLKSFIASRPEMAGEVFSRFSRAIEDANKEAVATAYREVLEKDFRDNKRTRIPARPIVFGGDDLTIIVRADLAFEFTRVFLEAFETTSERSLRDRLGEYAIAGLPQRLTACAGVSFTKKNYPFVHAYELSESLCAYAKGAGRKVRERNDGLLPSAFAFHKVTTSMAGDYRDIQEQELTGSDPQGRPVRLWMGPFGVGSHTQGLAAYQDLKELAQILESFPGGGVRTLIGTLYAGRTEARQDFSRLLQVARARDGGLPARLKTALQKLTGNEKDALWNEKGHTPLLEAYRLLELQRSKGKGAAHAQG